MGRRPETGTEALKLRLLKQASHALDGAICTSAECARQIGELTDQRVKGRVQHPQTMRSFDLTEKQQARRLLYLGRIETSKGIFMLLEAYLKTKATCPGLSLKFAGDGSASDRLQSEIAASGDPDVQFLGRLDAEGVHAELAQTDLLICPTTSAFNEGLAMVCLEAAAHGAPTLASSVIPAVDLLGAGCAVFRVDDIADLHRHLQHLVDDDAAFQTLAAATSDVRAGLSDRSRSWGSELCKVLMAL